MTAAPRCVLHRLLLALSYNINNNTNNNVWQCVCVSEMNARAPTKLLQLNVVLWYAWMRMGLLMMMRTIDVLHMLSFDVYSLKNTIYIMDIFVRVVGGTYRNNVMQIYNRACYYDRMMPKSANICCIVIMICCLLFLCVCVKRIFCSPFCARLY